MTPPSIATLQAQGLLTEKVYAFHVSEFINPWEDLMVHTQPIHQHLTTLNFIVREFKLKEVLELGTQQGYSTVALAYAVESIGGHLTSVDIKACPLANEKMKDRKLRHWSFFEKCDSRTLPWNKDVDCLFIDSEHSYGQMKIDLEKYEPFVKKGGFIILHDVIGYRGKGMCEAIDEYFYNFRDAKKYRYYRWFNDCGLGVVRKL